MVALAVLGLVLAVAADVPAANGTAHDGDFYGDGANSQSVAQDANDGRLSNRECVHHARAGRRDSEQQTSAGCQDTRK